MSRNAPQGFPMKIQAVIERATQDPKFAAQLQADAVIAQRAGFGEKEWNQFISHFADSPDDLERLRTPMRGADAAERLNTWTTTTTTTTLTSVPCTMTTTTTTTTVL
jgi:hypothetical protein